MIGPVVVVGDILLDRDVTGTVDRLCPDAPVPVLTETATAERPGGAGLAAGFLCMDGMDVVLVGAAGTDEAGDRVRHLLGDLGIELAEIPYAGCTPEKVRFRAQGHPLLRLDRGVEPGRLGEVPESAVQALCGASAVLVSDYGRGVTALAAMRRALADVATRVPVVWDPHPKGSTPVPGVRLACPNRAEAATFAAAHGADAGDRPNRGPAAVAAEAWVLRSAWRVGAVAVTMGADGALLTESDRGPVLVRAPTCRGGDTCGAGDRFSAASTSLLAAGRSVYEAVGAAVEIASAYVANGGPAPLISELTVEGVAMEAIT
jgi:D-beta-D-heptose 7-phosphate kinase / D-beta-D-heptose 1-phosphate adenosyltransferase